MIFRALMHSSEENKPKKIEKKRGKKLRQADVRGFFLPLSFVGSLAHTWQKCRGISASNTGYLNLT